MSWYYASGGQQQGPVEETQFDAMVNSGQIKPDDLVWKEGMANWQPLRTVRPSAASAGAIPPIAGAPPVMQSDPNAVTCVECGGQFTRDTAIQYGATWVCAACKPTFVQKLKEGATLGAAGSPPAMEYAGVWIRFGAKLIDGLILAVLVGIPAFLIMIPIIRAASRGAAPQGVDLMTQGLVQIVAILVPVAFNSFFLAKYGATPGKMAVGVKVVTADGAPLTFARAFGRAWAEQLSGLICYIGYLIAAFDSEKRTLHDHICSTRVIYK